jgi:hypothetical protein
MPEEEEPAGCCLSPVPTLRSLAAQTEEASLAAVGRRKMAPRGPSDRRCPEPWVGSVPAETYSSSVPEKIKFKFDFLESRNTWWCLTCFGPLLYITACANVATVPPTKEDVDEVALGGGGGFV